jgi:nuclear pore complex protein Nup155
MMGLFTDIGRAWVTIDNAIYLWDYANPLQELEGFEQQDNTITAVQLIKPRPGKYSKLRHPLL